MHLGCIGFKFLGICIKKTAIQLFRKVIFGLSMKQVPFLDICNTLLDPNLPLTVLDYEEFGDPRVLKEFETIRSYSPYDNICPGVCLPSVLVTTSFYDSR